MTERGDEPVILHDVVALIRDPAPLPEKEAIIIRHERKQRLSRRP